MAFEQVPQSLGGALTAQMPEGVGQETSDPKEIEVRKSGWKNFIDTINSDPALQSAVLNFGLNLMQPTPAGQSTGGHVARALQGSLAHMGAQKQQEAAIALQWEELRKKQELEARKVAVGEGELGLKQETLTAGTDLRGAQAEEARAQAEEARARAEALRRGKTGTTSANVQYNQILANALQKKAQAEGKTLTSEQATLDAAKLMQQSVGMTRQQFEALMWKGTAAGLSIMDPEEIQGLKETISQVADTVYGPSAGATERQAPAPTPPAAKPEKRGPRSMLFGDLPQKAMLPPSGDELALRLQQARDAIAAGRDPEVVKKMLQNMGINPELL